MKDFPGIKVVWATGLLMIGFSVIGVFKSIEAQDLEPVMPVQITGGDETYKADVTLQAGIRRLETSSVVTVQSTFGLHPQGSTFWFFGTLDDASGIGAAGDTVRLEIPAAVSPIGTTLYPAVDFTYTLVAGDISADNPEREVAENFCDGINLDSDFIAAQWKCELAKDFGYIHIVSRLFNEWGERTSYTTTCSGTTTCAQGFSDIAIRSKAAELASSPNDPARLGFFGITGTVLTIPGGFFEFFTNTEGTPSSSMIQDCDAGSFTAAACEFFVPVDNDEDVFISQVRCFAGCNGIKFGQHLCKNTKLSGGIEFEIRSDNEITTLPTIMSTQDWKNFFSFPLPGSAFRIDVQAGGDEFIATFQPELSFVIRKQGTFGAGNDDFIKITLNDNLTGSPGGNLDHFECIAEGFREE
jgi:hypothetical protein